MVEGVDVCHKVGVAAAEAAVEAAAERRAVRAAKRLLALNNR